MNPNISENYFPPNKPKALHRMHILLISFLAALLFGCQGLPQGVQPVTGFEVNRYLGKWYEISRLDHSFERGLSKVTADYSLREDGGLRVINRGYSAADTAWKDNYQYAFVSGPDTSYLWLLSRTPTVSQALLDRFIQKANALGFDTENRIIVDH